MVRKALIPIAGLATRMGPLAQAIPKAMWPVISSEGKPQPVLRFMISEALSAGIEQIGLVVSPNHIETIRRYFDASQKAGETKMAQHIEYILQREPEGFGAAIECGAAFTTNEPFLLLLGDHVHVQSVGQPSCAAQVVSAFHSQGGVAMVGMQVVGPEELCRVGIATGEALGNSIYRCTDIIEKPDIATARKRFVTNGLAKDHFLAHGGIYIFTTEIFGCLRHLIESCSSENAEVELTDAQVKLREQYPNDYYLVEIDGTAYDAGCPSGYLLAQEALRSQGDCL